MRVGVITFPGSNCDKDMIKAFKDLGHHTLSLWHKDNTLKQCDLVVIPGGFSYGDYLRSGAIARFSPIMEAVYAFAENGGMVFGVCNGFQILCEVGLLPGTLLHNNNQKFICKDVYIKSDKPSEMMTKSQQALRIPIAHGEGRYYADKSTLESMKNNGQILFYYCSASGTIDDQSNPNGSVLNIAGVCNAQKNVFGMMPHPERACSQILGNTDGIDILNYFDKALAL